MQNAFREGMGRRKKPARHASVPEGGNGRIKSRLFLTGQALGPSEVDKGNQWRGERPKKAGSNFRSAHS